MWTGTSDVQTPPDHVVKRENNFQLRSEQTNMQRSNQNQPICKDQNKDPDKSPEDVKSLKQSGIIDMHIIPQDL